MGLRSSCCQTDPAAEDDERIAPVAAELVRDAEGCAERRRHRNAADRAPADAKGQPARKFVEALGRAGIALEARGGELFYEAPNGAYIPEFTNALLDRRVELIAELGEAMATASGRAIGGG